MGILDRLAPLNIVSMKSGLEGRNNRDWTLSYKK